MKSTLIALIASLALGAVPAFAHGQHHNGGSNTSSGPASSKAVIISSNNNSNTNTAVSFSQGGNATVISGSFNYKGFGGW